ncbi:hypothetical protein R3W88_000845 [Solanum pinnatisectum]|uniref:Terpene synthase N-terminal domain-containing protein n=1 Tax=Solanum pinnatisectum TaxID=50273 RepID=A0AAV9MH28_9SOLN|nr:hypothetical protein R3W88_000845 [Solanum pinnatisectum]
MLIAIPNTSLEKLELIDKIQRSGVSYHFEEEIEASLQMIYEAYYECNNIFGDDNLYVVALGFRLLRQQGYFVSFGKSQINQSSQ